MSSLCFWIAHILFTIQVLQCTISMGFILGYTRYDLALTVVEIGMEFNSHFLTRTEIYLYLKYQEKKSAQYAQIRIIYAIATPTHNARISHKRDFALRTNIVDSVSLEKWNFLIWIWTKRTLKWISRIRWEIKKEKVCFMRQKMKKSWWVHM